MSPKHGPRRANVVFIDVAAAQIAKFSVAETIAADRAIVTVSTNPQIGDLLSDDSPVREYREPGTGVRVFYYATVLGSQIIVAYIEA
jgi:hypothetical protein